MDNSNYRRRQWHPTPVLLPGKSHGRGGAWWAAVHGVATSWTLLNDFTFAFHFHALEKEMATHSSVLAWRIPGTGEPGGLPSVGSHSVGHNWGDLAVAVATTLITEVILFSLKSLKRINFTLSVKCFLKKRKTADPKKAERKHWKEDRKFRFENLHYLSLNSQEVK